MRHNLKEKKKNPNWQFGLQLSPRESKPKHRANFHLHDEAHRVASR